MPTRRKTVEEHVSHNTPWAPKTDPDYTRSNEITYLLGLNISNFYGSRCPKIQHLNDTEIIKLPKPPVYKVGLKVPLAPPVGGA